MLKRGLVLFLVLLVLFNLIHFSLAQEVETAPGDRELSNLPASDEEEIEGDIGGGGITPDSVFYFVDEFFDRFGSCLKNREEKVAELREMIKSGKVAEAKVALGKYEKCAEEVEKEVSPEQKEEVERSSKLIRKAMKEIENDIPEGEKDAFSAINNREKAIITASEIAGKIKELCEQLAKLDPSQYEKTCRSGEDAPQWQKRLDKDLTSEQKGEAKKFGNIMESCFKTSGRDCRCDEIPFTDFASMCKKAAPLAISCDEGDEDACDKLDSLEMPELPDYLQDVMDAIEKQYGEASYDNHIPGPCKEAGITGREKDARDKCMAIMIENEAPDECRGALKEAVSKGIKSEREFRKICEEIMFKENAPEECVEAGLKDHKECGKFMFKENAPEECIEAGLTGENRNDPKKCEELMRNREGEEGGFRGPIGGFDCKSIQDSEERLKCYDNALEGIGGDFGRREGDENRGPGGGLPKPCKEAQALTRESCEKVMREWGETHKGEFDRDDFDERFRETKEEERRCAESCNGAWSFRDGNCECRQNDNYQPSYEEDSNREGELREGEGFGEDSREDGSSPGSSTDGLPEGSPTSGTGGESSGSGTESSGTDSGASLEGSGSGSSSEGGSSSSGSSEGGGSITGGVIFEEDNRFLDYYFR